VHCTHTSCHPKQGGIQAESSLGLLRLLLLLLLVSVLPWT
jgi:hypothetical protein